MHLNVLSAMTFSFTVSYLDKNISAKYSSRKTKRVLFLHLYPNRYSLNISLGSQKLHSGGSFGRPTYLANLVFLEVIQKPIAMMADDINSLDGRAL